jgi:hypothetical protein
VAVPTTMAYTYTTQITDKPKVDFTRRFQAMHVSKTARLEGDGLAILPNATIVSGSWGVYRERSVDGSVRNAHWPVVDSRELSVVGEPMSHR